MSHQYHHLGMMRSKRLGHIRHDRLDIGIPRTGFLVIISHTLSLSSTPLTYAKTEKNGGDYINVQAIRRFPLPRTMHNLYMDESPHILVKLAHQEINIEQVIELPAFTNHGVAQEVAQPDGVDIVGR